MRWENMFVAGSGASLGQNVITVDAAIQAGDYDPDAAAASKQLSATVAAPGHGSFDLAVAAAHDAIVQADRSPTDIQILLLALVLHADAADVWNTAATVQQRVGAQNCSLVSEVRSGCDGGLAALELACAYLSIHSTEARSTDPVALVVGKDAWPRPWWDRWHAASGMVYGDGAGALLMSRSGGFAQLRSLVTSTDPELETLHRGDGPTGQLPTYPIKMQDRARYFSKTKMNEDEMWRRYDKGLRENVHRATSEADVDLHDIDHVVYSFIGPELLARQCLDPLGVDISKTTYEFGRTVGDVGAAGPLVGFHHLVESKKLLPGQRALVFSCGSGLIWTSAVFEMLSQP